MGTEVQPKMYLPGYYSLQNLSSNVGHGSWSLLHENKSLKNGQQYDIFSTRPVLDGFHESNKEQLRQTILKHESTFRHQLNELHRLYERQKDLMNEIKSKEPLKHQKAAGASQSTFSSSRFPTEDDRKTWHISNLPLVDSSYGRPSTLSTGISLGKTLQTSGGPSQSRFMKDLEYSDSREKKPQRRFFNLELPADEYMSDGEEPEGAFTASGTESYPPNRKNEDTQARDKSLFNHIGETSNYNNSALSSGLHLERSNGLADLNEPIRIDKVSASTSVVKFGNDPSFKEAIGRQALSENEYKGVWPFAKKFPENPQMGKDGRICNLLLKNETPKEWSTSSHKGEQRSSSCGRFGLQDFNKPCESSETEARIACEPAKTLLFSQNKTEKQIKRTIFGIEISERDMNSSTKASQSDVTISESSPNWTKPSSSLGQNSISIQGYTSLNTSTQSNRSSVTRGRMLVDCNSIPSTPSLKVEVSQQNGFCFRTKLEANELQACHPPMSIGFPNGDSNHNSASERFACHDRQGNYSSLGPRVDAKSAIDVKQNIFSLQGPRNQESSRGKLHWLEEVPLCNGKSSKKSEGSHQLKIDSLYNYSKQFVNRTDLRKGPSPSPIQKSSSLMRGHDAESGRVEIGDCMSIRKTLALPMFDQASAAEESDMVQDSVSHMYREQLKGENLVSEKRLPNENADSRHQLDLNRCLPEEETEMTFASPIMRTVTVIDLEAPVIVETDIFGEDSMEGKCKEPLESPHEGLIRVAAEALVAISSSQADDMQDYAENRLQESAAYDKLDASEDDSLFWFAEIISSHNGNLDNENVAEVKGTACDEESFPDVDFFEHMTLNLMETKEEQPCYVPPTFDNPIEDVRLSKRPRRGQARRGRQRKDFQRDVLPGLASLSRNEVTDDLQIIEGLIRETGGSWQSSLGQRNAGKSGRGRGRGRKRMGTSAPSTIVAEVSQPQIEQPKCEEQQGVEEKSLAGWGKRTRRPPRQRYPIDSSPVPQK